MSNAMQQGYLQKRVVKQKKYADRQRRRRDTILARMSIEHEH